jgi:hypothetical protein
LILGTRPGTEAPARWLSRRRAGCPECSSLAGLAAPPTHSGTLPPAGLGPVATPVMRRPAQDIRFLAGLGADLIILDPNPDTPRPRDYACERNDLLTVRAALATSG